jgi:hypothetical protein
LRRGHKRSLLHGSACSRSWGTEPKLRRLIWEFDDQLRFTWVMGGLARQYAPDYRDQEAGIGTGADCFIELMAHLLASSAFVAV